MQPNGLLGRVALLSGWPTPDANAINMGESLESWKARAATLKGKIWVKKDGTTRYGNGNGAGMPIAIAALMTGWTTPCSQDGPNGGPNQGRIGYRERRV